MNELTKQIESHLRALQLKGLLAVYKEVAEKAVKRHLQYEEYLAAKTHNI